MPKIFGYQILKGKDLDKRIDDLEKAALDAKYTNRPQIDPQRTLGGDEIRLPFYPMPPQTLYEMAQYSDVLRNIIISLKKELFRNGYDIEEKFAKKCGACGKEFEHPVLQCDCGSLDMKDPDIKQKEGLEKLFAKVNINDQEILDVLKEFNDDLEIIDDGYILMLKDYSFSAAGKLIGWDIKEILRIHPIFTRIIADKTGRPSFNMDNVQVMTCLEHRNNIWPDKDTCPICGKETFPAYYRVENGGRYIYYVKDEVFHKSKYSPTLVYGFSLIYAAWMKIVTLMSQDKYMKDYYTKQRPPRGLLFVKTPNMPSLEKAWNWMLDQFRKNPHMIPPIAIEGTENKGKFVEFIDFMRTLDEMQFVETRNEFRRQIGALYGVMPLFQADLTQSGGLNNEGLQITVTNRAVEDGQNIYNQGFFPWLLKQLEITDYKVALNPSEEKDEMAELQRDAQKITNARMMQDMGYDVTFNEDGDFEYEPTEVPVEKPQAPAMGGLGNAGPTATNVESDQQFSGQPENVRRSADVKKKSNDISYEEETALISENKKKPEAGQPHKFKAAQWTAKNGHPRCLICGDEETTSGWCNKARIYLKPDEKAPEGYAEQQGPAGGRFYDSEGKQPAADEQPAEGKPFGETGEPKEPHAEEIPEEADKIIEQFRRKPIGEGKEATINDHKTMETILQYGRYGFISAGRNPSSPEDKALTDEQIKQRTEALRQDLIKAGYVFTPTLGNYGEYEDSFLVMVHDAEEFDLIDLGAKYNQESIIYCEKSHNKLIYTSGENKGKMVVGEGWKPLPDDQKSMFTSVNLIGEGKDMKFTLIFDFDAMVDYNREQQQKDIAAKIKDFERPLNAVHKELKEDFPKAEVHARLKTVSSIYEKMQRKGADVQSIRDIGGAMAIFEGLDEVKQAKEMLRSKYKVLDEDDYLEKPHDDDYYRSYHMTVEQDGKPIEIQLKTKWMAMVQERGHDILYKNVAKIMKKGKDAFEAYMEYMKQVSEYFYRTDLGQKLDRPKPPQFLIDMGGAI